MKYKTKLTLLFLFICSSNNVAQQKSTWEVIQDKILTPNCTSCHVAGSSFAIQSGLVLTKDVAYKNIANGTPNNEAARGDGLLLVGNKGLESLYKSYLWEKIDAPDQEHFYSDHPYYGSLMPLGAPPLTNGQLKFMKEWILAGIPETGIVADESILEDTSRFEIPEFQPLLPPEHGVQLHLGPFDVQPNFEREFFYYLPLNNKEEIFINRVEINMRRGSHHFIAYQFNSEIPDYLIPQANVIRDIRNSDGSYNILNLLATPFHTFVTGTQWPNLNYHLPPGVALRLPANIGLDLNLHYVNRTDEIMQGEIYTNLHFVEPKDVVHEAKTLNLGKFDIELPPHQVTTLTKVFTFWETRYIFQLFSHAHEHMTEFRVEIDGGPRNGDLVYITYDWEHPPILELDPPLVIEEGQGLKLITTYNNWTDRTLNFGLRSDDEMMILFGGYYLKTATSVEDNGRVNQPEVFTLEQNYPNPFNPQTTISYKLPQQTHVNLAIYDITGRIVEQLLDDTQPAGVHQIIWNANGAPSGMYIVRIKTDSFQSMRKMLYLK